MVESRVHILEQTVGDLREIVAAQTVEIKHLATNLKELQEQLRPLTESVARGKGALTLAVILASTFGALISTAVRRLFID